MNSSTLFEPVRATMPCAVCGGQDATVVGVRGRDGAALRSVACRACGLVWSDPRPHDVRPFYEHDYRQAYKKVFTPRPKHVLRAGRVALDRGARIRDLLRPGLLDRVYDEALTPAVPAASPAPASGWRFALLATVALVGALARLGRRIGSSQPRLGALGLLLLAMPVLH